MSIIVFAASFQSAKSQNVRPKWVDDLKGTSGVSMATSLAVDPQDNIYVTGNFSGTVDFDPSSGVKALTSLGGLDIFLGKYKQDGTLIWVVSFGGSATDEAYGLAVDKLGNVTISGYFSSLVLDADPGSGIYNLNNSSQGGAAYLIHLDNTSKFLWANSSSSASGDIYYRVAADSQGNVVATGDYFDDFTVGNTTYQSNNGGLIVKYDNNGNLLWVIPFSAAEVKSAVAFGAAIDSHDNIIISGTFNGTLNFNPFGAAHNLTSTNNTSYVAKYSPAGILSWVNRIDNTSIVAYGSSAVSTDPEDNVCFSEPFAGSLNFGGVTLPASGAGDNLCIAKYSSAGMFQFAKGITSTQYIDYDSPITNDKNGNIYLTGYFTHSANFNPSGSVSGNVSSHGQYDFYLAKYDQYGNFIYVFNEGSPSCQSTLSNGIAIDNADNIDIAGSFCSNVNFDPSGCSSQNLTAASASDPFIAQYATATLANNIIAAPVITGFCTSGAPGVITGSSPTGGSGAYTYQWQSSPDSVTFTNINGATAQNYTPPVITVTTYYRRVVTPAACAAPGLSNVIKLTIAAPPSAPDIVAVSTCAGSAATLMVTSPQAGLTYNWYSSATSDTVLFSGSSFTTPVLTAAATYYAVTANSGGCISATRTVAVVSILPVLNVPVVTAGATTSSSVIFTWTAVPGATGYQASTDGGQTYSATSPALADTVSGLQGGQSISILVKATGSIACQVSAASAAVTATAIDPDNNIIYVPNAFTPNGDGRNDQVHVRSENIKTLKFYIYDQWGELLFTSASVEDGWDGTYKGKKEPAGAYVYSVEATMNDGQQVHRKGTITLLR